MKDFHCAQKFKKAVCKFFWVLTKFEDKINENCFLLKISIENWRSSFFYEIFISFLPHLLKYIPLEESLNFLQHFLISRWELSGTGWETPPPPSRLNYTPVAGIYTATRPTPNSKVALQTRGKRPPPDTQILVCCKGV